MRPILAMGLSILPDSSAEVQTSSFQVDTPQTGELQTPVLFW
jgi:hypothetical protein